MDRAQCEPFLRDLHAVLPLHANASVLDLDGNFVCSARPLSDPPPAPVRHSAFESAIRGEAGLSEPVLDAPDKRWIVAAAHPVRDAAGTVVGVVTITMDLAKLGYSSAAIRGRPLNLLIPARFHGSHDQHIRRFGETGVTNRAMGKLGEIAGLRANGEEFPIEASISQLATPQGKLFTVILRDVTERRKTEAALRQYADDMRDLTMQLAEVEENERRSIHRELHDQVGANLAALKLDLGFIPSTLPEDLRNRVNERLQRALQVTGETIARIRNVMADLRPPALDDFGLSAALRMHAESVAARLRIPVEVRGRDLEPRLAPAVETALFRVESAPGRGTRITVDLPRGAT